ncbi:MAG TPA: HAMP domain-containing sensor histidine kinase [Candidatus Limnocylindria bacterium]|nr:HAMP domain-containing sensor histidine kinase [Candidatus Limnocylindria bacterium]
MNDTSGTSVGPGPAAVPESERRGSLAWRIGLMLAGVVLVILVVTGIVVNRVVSSGFQSVLATQEQARLDTAADALVEALSRPAPLIRAEVQLQRLANSLGGRVRILRANGTQLASVGRVPAGETRELQARIESNGTLLGTLVATVPAGASPDSGFLRLFNLTLIGAGLVSLVAIVLLAAYAANRLTRPLRAVAVAAHRLGSGDLSARARGGDDRESAELADAFNLMADRLERSEALRRRAASDMAHDLATPATVLESQLQAMVDGVVPADREQLEAARSAAGALGSVIGQMGELASAESAPLQRRAARVEVTAAVAEVVRTLDGLARDRGVSVVHEPGVAVFALVDPDQLGRAVRNVVTNAIQHSPAGGTVQVATWATPTDVQVRISDQGPGIAAADLPHVFERFYRADVARTGTAEGERRGSGIGLTIARELLGANGGRIGVERTGPEGTTFLLELPRVG